MLLLARPECPSLPLTDLPFWFCPRPFSTALGFDSFCLAHLILVWVSLGFPKEKIFLSRDSEW